MNKNSIIKYKKYFKRHSLDIYFVLIGTVLIVIILFLFFSSTNFLVKSIDEAINSGNIKNDLVRFNINGLKMLNIYDNNINLNNKNNKSNTNILASSTQILSTSTATTSFATSSVDNSINNLKQ